MSEITIDEAFCIERDMPMSIEDVRSDYFLHKEELHFECPDDECRKALHPRIAGVNYKKRLFIKTPHFRDMDKEKHIQGCGMRQYNDILLEVLNNPKKYGKGTGNTFQIGEKVKPAQVPDIFIPPWQEKISKKEQRDYSHSINKRTKKDDKIEYVKNRKKKTNFLEYLAEIFATMSEKDKETFNLSIEGEKYPYGKIFKPIKFLKNYHTWPHIYYGKCRVYPKKNIGYTIYFNDEVISYSNSESIPATILIESSKESENPYLHEKLAEMAKAPRANIATCYVFGKGIHVQYCDPDLDREKYCGPNSKCITFMLDTQQKIALFS